MNEIIKKNSTKFGLIGGGLAIAYFLVAYLIDESLWVNKASGVLLWLAYITIFVLGVVQSKKQLGGFITFKEAFSGFMLAAIIYSLLVTVFSMLLFNVVDPDLAVRLKETSLEKNIELLETLGQSDDEIALAIEKIENIDSFSIVNMGKSFIYGILGYSLLGLIVAAILKRNRPEFADMEMNDDGEDS